MMADTVVSKKCILTSFLPSFPPSFFLVRVAASLASFSRFVQMNRRTLQALALVLLALSASAAKESTTCQIINSKHARACVRVHVLCLLSP